MTQRLYGNRFIFSSRDDSSIIRLSADVGETLLIDGYTPTVNGLGTTASVFLERKARTNPQLEPYQNITYSNTTTARNNGTSTDMADDIDNVWLISGCPSTTKSSLGGVAVYKSTNGSNFVENSLLTNQTFTSTGYFGKTCSIDFQGSLVAFTDGALSNPVLNLYKRIGDVWSFTNYIDDCYYFKNYGTKAIASTYNNVVRVMNNTGAGNNTWVNSQTLTVVNTGVEAHIPLVDMWSYTLAFSNKSDESVRVYLFDNTNWVYNQQLNKDSGEGIITGLSVANNVLVFCTPETVYICTRDSSNIGFNILQRIANNSETFTGCKVVKSGQISYISNSSVYIRNKSETSSTYDLVSSNTSPSQASMSSSNNFTVFGQPSLERSRIFKTNFFLKHNEYTQYDSYDSGVFTLGTPSAGLYLITSEIVFEPNGYQGSREVNYLVGGVVVSKSTVTGDMNRLSSVTNTIIINLTANQTVFLQLYQLSEHIVKIQSGRFNRVKLTSG